MNRLTITGRLTKNPRGGIIDRNGPPRPVCDFTVAATAKPGAPPVYVRVTCYDGAARTCMNCLHKGSAVAVAGPVMARAYRAGGDEIRASLEMQAEEIEFFDEEDHHA